MYWHPKKYVCYLNVCIYFIHKKDNRNVDVISRNSKYILGSSLMQLFLYLGNSLLFPKQNGRIIKLTSILGNTHKKDSHYSRCSEVVPLCLFSCLFLDKFWICILNAKKIGVFTKIGKYIPLVFHFSDFYLNDSFSKKIFKIFWVRNS